MSADTTDDTDHMLPGPLDTDHQLPQGDDVPGVSVSPQPAPIQPAQEAQSSPQPQQSAPPSPKHSHLTAAILSVLTFTAIVLLGWMIWTSPLVEGTRGGEQPLEGAVEPQEAQPVRIGVMLPLTGDAASYGRPFEKVVQLSQKEINDDGGIGNQQIVLEWEDSRCDGTAAKLAAEKLVNEKQVQYLIAGACSSEYLSAAPVAQQKKVLSFSSSATSPKISQLGSYVFRTAPSDALAGKAAAAYAINKWNAKSAAIVIESSEYPEALRNVFMQEFTAFGGTIVTDESFDTGETDFSDIITKLQTNTPDVIYLVPQTPTPGLLLVSAIKQARLDSKVLTAEVLLLRDTVAKQGNLLEGVTGVELFFDETRQKTQDFFRKYKAEYGLELNAPTYMAGMYDIFYLIREAHLASGGDPDRANTYLHKLKDWNGAVGVINFDKNGDPSFSYAIRTITNGEATLVDEYTPKSGQ